MITLLLKGNSVFSPACTVAPASWDTLPVKQGLMTTKRDSLKDLFGDKLLVTFVNLP